MNSERQRVGRFQTGICWRFALGINASRFKETHPFLLGTFSCRQGLSEHMEVCAIGEDSKWNLKNVLPSAFYVQC
jgi:hypothetical protein